MATHPNYITASPSGTVRLLSTEQLVDAARGGSYSATNALVQKLCGMKPDEYRGWPISFDYPPIPVRDFDWSATHPDYDCDCDEDGFFATSGAVVHGATRDAVIAEIDAWYVEQGV